jgi:SAM-dependent methyltransferase
MRDQEKLFPATVMPDPNWWHALWPDPIDVLKNVGLKEGLTAIDLCCGDGLFTTPMSVLLDGKVYAVDLDPDMLALAEQAIKKAGAPSCTFIEGDARDMTQLIPVQVDIILIANTFHGVPEQTELARNASEVLNSDGKFIIINWHKLPREKTTVLGEPRGPRTELRMSPEDVRTVVEPVGFQLADLVEIPPYHYGAVFKKS